MKSVSKTFLGSWEWMTYIGRSIHDGDGDEIGCYHSFHSFINLFCRVYLYIYNKNHFKNISLQQILHILHTINTILISIFLVQRFMREFREKRQLRIMKRQLGIKKRQLRIVKRQLKKEKVSECKSTIVIAIQCISSLSNLIQCDALDASTR